MPEVALSILHLGYPKKAGSHGMEHISVCICTFKRPNLLRGLLSGLEHQRTDGLFNYSVVVVDNDYSMSAQDIVRSFQQESNLEAEYYVEREQNIALARNKAVENARGDFIAFLDDDEFPPNDWLFHLYIACQRFRADGVLGPVNPHFEGNCPKWIVKGRLVERTSHSTGTIMKATDTRTGNVLLKREIFEDADNRFEPAFGRTGGEDVWFFVKVIAKGRVFVWCEEAPVYESVPPERWKASYYLKRFIRIGGLTGEEVRKKGLPGQSPARVTVAFCVYVTILPFAMFLGKHTFMRYLVKSAYNFSWLSGYFGKVILRARDD
jgi:succinoglycan biosynthesis protein ExoM